MRVWTVFANGVLQEIFDHRPSILDLQKFAAEEGWPVEWFVQHVFIEEWTVRETWVRSSNGE